MSVRTYSLSSYGAMSVEPVRMGAYTQALKEVITEDSIVVDIGAGAGIFSLLASQFGAKHVHAIEPDSSIKLAKKIAADNNLTNITFHEALSTDVHLDQPADIIVSDLRSILPLFEYHIPTMVDARQRLLKPDGILIPQRDRIFMTLVTAQDFYQRRYRTPWVNNDYGLDMRAGYSMLINEMSRIDSLTEYDFLTEPQLWATLDYATITEPTIQNKLEFTVSKSGIAHGVAAWFEAQIYNDIGFSNDVRVAQRPQIYYNYFFPFEEPVNLNVGDRIDLTVWARFSDGNYLWAWQTTIHKQDTPADKIRFNQSTAFAGMLNPQSLAKHRQDHTPTLSTKGKITAWVLEQFKQDKSLSDIATEALQVFPDDLSDWNQAFSRVSDLSNQFSD